MDVFDTADSKPSTAIDVEDFSKLVGDISRILTVITQIRLFGEANIGLAEWVGLWAFRGRDEIDHGEFARHVGAKGARVKEIVNSLVRGKLVVIEQSGEGPLTLRITHAGKAKLEEVNERLKPLLSAALQGMERSLFAASKQLRLLARSLDAGRPARSKGLAKRQSVLRR